MAFNYYNKISLVSCNGCGRTFLPDRLEVHLKSCKGGGVQQEEKRGFASKPRGIICYICGREYGTASIDIHLKTCKKKWEDEEAKKPKKDRRPLPQPPKDFDNIKIKGSSMKQSEMDALNEEAFHKFNEESRVPCPNCGRKFLPDRLEVHLRSCKSKDGGATVSSKPKSNSNPSASSGSSNTPVKESSGSKSIVMPKALVCYICGNKYGTQSLNIHLKACKKKWEDQEALKPPGERKPVPEPPKAFDEVATKGQKGAISSADMEKYNADAFQDWNEKVLEPCPNCGRTFLPDRLQVHLKSCKGPKEDAKEKAKNSMASAKAKEASEDQPKKEKKKPESIAHLIRAARLATKEDTSKANTVAPTKSKAMNAEAPSDDGRTPCPLCNRKFAPDRFDVHYNICAKKNGGPVKSSGGAKPGFKASYD
eukprot:TRINITY_DN2946_c0_g1_i8.p1 TRINITY_DN2946_c0_g1~~TRINITY_DN2946_c0_g1_i8.p1  ORF type:complete len:423 (-),score=150.52 TRINITY_DN2946_c0_g1_i8:150-1418(-)